MYLATFESHKQCKTYNLNKILTISAHKVFEVKENIVGIKSLYTLKYLFNISKMINVKHIIRFWQLAYQ